VNDERPSSTDVHDIVAYHGGQGRTRPAASGDSSRARISSTI
jgi:hypothetical protein